MVNDGVAKVQAVCSTKIHECTTTLSVQCYFNPLLCFQPQKDELDDNTIELSKVQSVKVVAKKRRDRGLPRAFEIFTDNKTYVLKAEDEKHAEEWLQCINVAVAQAKERESREATTYL